MSRLTRFVLQLAASCALAAPVLGFQDPCMPGHWPEAEVLPGGRGVRFPDLEFGRGPEVLLDVLLPSGWSGAGDRPTLLFVHGGGGLFGDKYEPEARTFLFELLERGYPVVSTNYMLAVPDCSSGTFFAAAQDVRAAVHWIRRGSTAGTSGTDVCLSRDVVVVGTSFGGTLGALAGTLWRADDSGLFDAGIDRADYRVDLVITISGGFDYYTFGAMGSCPAPICETLGTPFPDPSACGGSGGFPAGYPMLDQRDWRDLPFQLPNGCWPPEASLGCSWDDPLCAPPFGGVMPTGMASGNAFVDASPRNWVDAEDVPFVLYHGRCDPIAPYDQSIFFRDALKAVGIPVQLRAYQSDGHGVRSDGLLIASEAADAVDLDVTQWLDGRRVATIGCGLNPPDSLRVLEGRAALGRRLVLGVDNPWGTQMPGAVAFLFASTAPDPNFPCGTPVQNFGMAGLGTKGEALVDLLPPNPITQMQGEEPWEGPGIPVALPALIPNDPALVDQAFYVQGILADFGAVSTVRFGFTEGLVLVVTED